MTQALPRHAPTALALAAGLIGGLSLGILFPAPAPEAGPVAAPPAPMLAEIEPEPVVCGPDPFYEMDQEASGALCQAEDPAEAELRAQVRRESGLLAGRLGRLRTGPKALRERFPAFPGAFTPIQDVGDQIASNGVPMNLAFFETRASAPQILEYYAQHFSSRGWSWTGIKENYDVIPHPAISAADPEERVQMTVMVLEEAADNGVSTVILGLADMLALAEDPAADVGDLPVFPGSEPLAMRALDAEVQSLTVSYKVPEPLETLSTFYSEQMRERGYAEPEAEPARADENGVTIRSMRFAAQGGQWAVVLTSSNGETGVTAVHTNSAEANP